MSNHTGSHMLSRVLNILKDEYDFFENMTYEEKIGFIQKILSIGCWGDCNDGEILSGMAKYLNYCYLCKSKTSEINEEKDICNKCYDEYYSWKR